MRTELVTTDGTVVSLRHTCAGDEGFLHELYRDRRAPELAGLGWSHEDQDAFIDMQFRAQQDGYGSTFPEADHWLVIVDGERAGRLLVDCPPGERRVVDVTLLTAYRGRGIGSALMQETIDGARVDDVPVKLSAASHDERLVGWYRRLGFSVVGERPPNLAMAWSPSHAG